ncbi:unnamed protein product, partial [Didymodactylos carnosus]
IATALMTNQTLTTLDLADNKISADGAKAIATALMTNQTLTTLDLGYNQISADEATAIAAALMTNQTLTTLNLWNNQISADGAKAIATALMTNQTLTTLNLWNNQISADGAKAIAAALMTNQTLTTLDLGYNQISADGATAIATALMTNQTLTTLDLGYNQISADEAKAIATALMTNQTLTTLDLEDNSISADGAKAIATALMTNQTLTTLSLGYTRERPQTATVIPTKESVTSAKPSLCSVNSTVFFACSRICDGGMKERTNLCFMNNRRVPCKSCKIQDNEVEKCNIWPCPKCRVEVDVGILLDSSSSIKEWAVVVNATSEFVPVFKNQNVSVLFGIVLYANRPQIFRRFNQPVTIEDIRRLGRIDITALKALPPTIDAAHQHFKRAAVAVNMWCRNAQSLICDKNGFENINGNSKVKWITKSTTPDPSLATSCGCKSGNCKSCICVKSNLKCIPKYCSCDDISLFESTKAEKSSVYSACRPRFEAVDWDGIGQKLTGF